MSQPHADDLRWLKRIGIACVAVGAVFLILPQIDLWVAGAFFDPQTGKFPLARAPIPLFFNDFIEQVAIVMALASLAGLAYTLIRKTRIWALGARQFTFLILSLITGPGLVANALFKENWGRARPRQITEFGGSWEFAPPLVMSDQCPSNCSFVSGDASMGFTLLALALVIPFARKTWVIAALGFGAFIGAIRIVQGAHFFSDVIYAGLFVSASILVLKMIVLDRAWGIADTVDAWFGGRTPATARRLGLHHDDDTMQWRRERFSDHRPVTWKRRLWLFFRSGPKDFGMPAVKTTGPDRKEGRHDGQPSSQ